MSDLITSQMLSDWRANYGLDKRTPIKAMHWWQDNMDGKAPAGVVAALGLCINEIERLTAERDDLRRQLDPMGEEFASADELIAALRAEKAEDDAMKRDAECWRELDRMMSDPDARLNVNAGGWAVLKCGLLGKLGASNA